MVTIAQDSPLVAELPMLIKQPQHLTRLMYRQTFFPILCMAITYAVYLSVLLVAILYLKISKGENPGADRWVTALSLGPICAVGILMFYRKFGCRRHLDLRDNGVHLSHRGLIQWSRILEWTIAPWSADSRITRITLKYKLGRGHKLWSMLLDDPEQISKLRNQITDLSPTAR